MFHNCPKKFGESLQQPASERVVLGIDPGTSTGYAIGFVLPSGGVVYPSKTSIGVWDLSIGDYDSGAIRFLRLRYFLDAVKPSLVYMESSPIVTIHSILASARQFSLTNQELLAAYRATVALWCEQRQIPLQSVAVGAVKKRATGKGNANKLDVIKAANKEFDLGLPPEENRGYDNAADAAFICAMALEGLAPSLCRKVSPIPTTPPLTQSKSSSAGQKLSKKASPPKT